METCKGMTEADEQCMYRYYEAKIASELIIMDMTFCAAELDRMHDKYPEHASQISAAEDKFSDAAGELSGVLEKLLPGPKGKGAEGKGPSAAYDAGFEDKWRVSAQEVLAEYTSTRADRLTVKELKEVFGLDEMLAAQPEYSGARAKADAEERTARRELAYEAHTGGMSAKRIAECLDVSKSTVYRDLKAYTQSQNDAAKAA
jgi:hypothetical protein